MKVFKRTNSQKENLADLQAAKRMTEIYDEICEMNPIIGSDEIRALNVFLSRLLFCFFADNIGIFPKHIFTKMIEERTKEDGSDLDQYFGTLFELLNTPESARQAYPAFLNDFPYVNEGLFKEKYNIPRFSYKLRELIIECGKMEWLLINPDIFGSMIQAVAHPNQRSDLGMHYTSVSNIMKVIQPLFLDEFYQAFEMYKDDASKLAELHQRLASIKIFDPACGSGNFLIITYKELCKFEIKLLKRLQELGKSEFVSQIQLSQCYGLELDDFACETARLSLWLAQHQMTIEFKQAFGIGTSSLSIKQGGCIICCNATRLDWELVCSKNSGAEIYLLGNPPYQGARKQSDEQKADIAIALHEVKDRNNLDYVSCWIVKAAKYISNTNAKAAFVTTNSITQGMQVPILWPAVFSYGVEIGFAYTSFKWINNAKNNAGVTCVIIGLRNVSDCNKYIFENEERRNVENINGYLSNSKNIFVSKRKGPLSSLPDIVFGSMPNEAGYLLLSAEEKEALIKEDPRAKAFIRKIMGGEEFIEGIERFCLWINDAELAEALSILAIKERVDNVKRARQASKRVATRKLSQLPHRFGEIRHQEKDYILMPSTTSEKRDYFPIGLFSSEVIAKNTAHIIYGANPVVFGILSSKMHHLWAKAVAGRLEMRIIYSAEICYNNFPVPQLSAEQEEIIKARVCMILHERKKHSEKTIAELYDPKKMPEGLRIAHLNLDVAIENCYRSQPFESDEERLECLFKLYEEMIKIN